MEEKTSKYNYGEPIPLDLIPIEDTELALKEFANGSIGLEKCLRIMWMHGLRTYASYPGGKNTFDIGYIVMEEGEDVFSYLSEEFLNDDRIRIDIVDERQEIKFSGSLGEKEGALLFLAREIDSGRKKDNSELLLKKIGEPYPNGWVRRLRTYQSNIDSTYWSEKVYIKKKR